MKKAVNFVKNVLGYKIDFVVVIGVDHANPNGNPLDNNRPRTDSDGFGEIADVCSKRKVRNRQQDMGEKVFVQSDARCDDGCKSLSKRAEDNGFKNITDPDEFAEKACAEWIDVRTFGQVFAYNSLSCKSVGVRGPVSIRIAKSVCPVEIVSMQITKSVNGEQKKKGKEEGAAELPGKSSDTMGMKHFVKHGVYILKGTINVQLAEKTGFTEEDAEILKKCLLTMFENDASSARPEGSMEVLRLYWFKHNNKSGQYSSAVVHRSVKVTPKEGILTPSSYDDYDYNLVPLDGLDVEIYTETGRVK